jgi:hypothetical protein
MFFFEKKNHKADANGHRARKDQKSFASFLQKRSPSLRSLAIAPC